MSQISKSPTERPKRLIATDDQILAAIAANGGAATSGTLYRTRACELTQQGLDYRLNRLARRGALALDRSHGVKIFILAKESESRRTALAGGDQHD